MKKLLLDLSLLLGITALCFASSPASKPQTESQDGGRCVIAFDCTTVPVIACDSEVSGSTVGAMNVIGNPAGDAVYRLDLSSPKWISLDLCDPNTNYDTYLRVYDRCLDDPDVVQLAYNDDGQTCTESSEEGLVSRIDNLLLPVGSYYIVVEGYSGNEGSFNLSVSCQDATPVDFADTIECGDTVTGSTVGNYSWLNTESGDACYLFSPDADVSVELSLCSDGTSFDTILSIWEFQGPIFSLLASNDDYCGTASRLIYAFEAGLDYLIVVDGYYSAEGTYELALNCQVDLSPCDDALALVCGDVVEGNTTDGVSYVGNESADAFYTFEVTTAGEYTFSTCGSSFDTYLRLYDVCPLSANQIADNDDFCGLQSQISITLDPGTYFIVVEGYTEAEGAYLLSVQCPQVAAAVEQPEEFALAQNYPNPFNPTTTIDFSLAETGIAHLAVYNMSGQRVAILVNGLMESGAHSVNFNASSLASGVYFYTLQAGDQLATKKLVLMK